MLNRISLIGRLGKTPELKRLENGTYYSRFSIATWESWQDENEQWQEATEWHNVVVWGKMAERAARKYSKGDFVYIEGKMRTRSYTKDDEKRYVSEVQVLRIIKEPQKLESAFPPPIEEPFPQ